MDKGNWEKASLRRVAQKVTLHPVFVLGLLVDYHDGIAFFEGQLVVVIGFAVVQSSTKTFAGEILAL